jgi:hypothetical protein
VSSAKDRQEIHVSGRGEHIGTALKERVLHDILLEDASAPKKSQVGPSLAVKQREPQQRTCLGYDDGLVRSASWGAWPLEQLDVAELVLVATVQE